MRTITRIAVMGLLGAILAIHGMLFWHNWDFARQGYCDFTIFYTAGTILRRGLGHHLYDPALQYQVQQSFASGVQNRSGPLPYNHPAFEALLFVPLSRLGYATAYAVWDLLNLGILSVLPFLLRPHVPLMQRTSPLLWLLVLLAFFPVLATLMQGQDVILLLLFFTLAFVALKRNDERLTGFWLGLGLFRFHLIIPLVLILLGWKRRRATQGFLLTAVVLVGISLLVTGWREALHYPAYVLHLEGSLGRGAIFPAVMPNLRGLLEGWPHPRDLQNLLLCIIIAVSLGLLLWVIRYGRGPTTFPHQFGLQFSLATVATVLVCFHAYAYDLSILIIPALLLASYVRETRRLQPDGILFLLLPVAVLFCTPLYILLGFRSDHLNLFALVELPWLWAIRREMAVAATGWEGRSS